MSAARGRSAGPVVAAGWAWLRSAARGVAWWYSAINGGQDYRRYVEHRRRTHPGEPIASERDYWRERYAEADRNPTNRCC